MVWQQYQCVVLCMQGISQCIAKIGLANAPSQRLFLQLGYQEKGRSDIFREIAYGCMIADVVEQIDSVRSTMRYQALSFS